MSSPKSEAGTSALLRMPKWLRSAANETAKRQDVSLNKLMVNALMRAVETDAGSAPTDKATYQVVIDFSLPDTDTSDFMAHDLLDAARDAFVLGGADDVVTGLRRTVPLRNRSTD
jgi:hypothetical protein